MFKATSDQTILVALEAGCVVTDPETGFVQVAGRPARADASGYMRVRCGRQDVLAHRVMWLAHHPETPSTLQVNHRNGCRWDNRLCNLELVTQGANMQHAYGIAYAAVGTAEDDNVVDPEWFERVMELAARGDATKDEIRALKRSAPITDGTNRVYTSRPITRPLRAS